MPVAKLDSSVKINATQGIRIGATVEQARGCVAALNEYRAFGHDVLVQAGRIAAADFRRTDVVADAADKSDGGAFDPVTGTDRRVEAAIRDRIAARFPTHGIYGEELGDKPGTAAWRWIVDPIDGTRAYIAGLPVWGCLLGLLHDGEPVLGWMHQPVVGETFCGDGREAWVSGNAAATATIRARGSALLTNAVLACTHPAMFQGQARQRFERLAGRTRMTRFGGDCYNYCLLAHGLVDLVVEDDLRPHDILPLVPIVRGAGGVISDLSGETPRGGLVVAAANARLHAEALRAMRG